MTTFIKTISMKEIESILIQGHKSRDAMKELSHGSIGQGLTTGSIKANNAYSAMRLTDRYWREVKANLLYSDTLLSRF